MVSQSRRTELRRGAIQFGHLLRRGEGVAEDLVEAYKWLLLAVRQGNENAKEDMTLLESEGFWK